MAVLLVGHLHYDWTQTALASSDHRIFSKGHASPFWHSGVISEDELVKTYRQNGARLEGHPTPVLPWMDVATGSLGQGLPTRSGSARSSGVGGIFGVAVPARNRPCSERFGLLKTLKGAGT
jgi:transketolase